MKFLSNFMHSDIAKTLNFYERSDSVGQKGRQSLPYQISPNTNATKNTL